MNRPPHRRPLLLLAVGLLGMAGIGAINQGLGPNQPIPPLVRGFAMGASLGFVLIGATLGAKHGFRNEPGPGRWPG